MLAGLLVRRVRARRWRRSGLGEETGGVMRITISVLAIPGLH